MPSASPKTPLKSLRSPVVKLWRHYRQSRRLARCCREDIIEATKADLKENPPRQFDLARLERVFNYKLEFVEFSVARYKLNRFLWPFRGIAWARDASLQQRFRNTFRVFKRAGPFRFKIKNPNDAEQEIELTEKVA